MRTFIIGICIWSICSGVQAMPSWGGGAEVTGDKSVAVAIGARTAVQRSDHWRHVAENTPDTPKEPESGSLVIPGEDEATKDKKCMNLCKKWGENCIINPRTGARDCRRTCKEFGVECF